MQGLVMSIHSNLKVLIARENLRRAEAMQPALTMRGLARETGLALSVLWNLASHRSERVDFKTLDKLCSYFKVGVGELLVWEPEQEQTSGGDKHGS